MQIADECFANKEVNKEDILRGMMLCVQMIDKLGPLEYVLNTPSYHRVHHGVNRYCIDKNYAGMFIVWDRLFGMLIFTHIFIHRIQ